MKSLLLLAAMPAVIWGQSPEGIWQGTLTPVPNREIRIAFKITKDGTAYQGLYYNLAVGRQFNLGAITLQGNTIKIVIPGMGGTYDGKFEADGNSITGTLTQGGNTLALPLKRANAETAWELPASRALPPLPEGTKAEFEVASIKPSPGGRPPAVGFNVSATELRSPNISVAGLITFAFELHRSQVVGLPSWAETEGYEITARLPQGGDPSDAQLRTMLKNLLQSRFGLAFHTETRELSIYAIGFGQNGRAGVKMTTNTTSGLRMGSEGLGRVRFQGATMGHLAAQLQLRVLDRPVIDQTGLKDRYDFTVNWRPDEFQFPAVPAERRATAAASNDALPDLFTAFQEQLGLKLQPTKATVAVLVVDKVSRPSEN
jgi:uncharacterized protein (TIGR03435 family)